MRTFLLSIFLLFTGRGLLNGQSAGERRINPAIWIDAVLAEREDTICNLLGQLDIAKLETFESEWPGHFCFLKAVCLSFDISKADSVRAFILRAQYYLKATRIAAVPGERWRRKAMRKYLDGLQLDMDRLRPVNGILTRPAVADAAVNSLEMLTDYVDQTISRNIPEEPPLTRLLAADIISDTFLHWRGITMDEFDQGLTLNVSKKPFILDSLYLHVPQIVVPLEEYLIQNKLYVAKIEIEADLSPVDLGVLTDSVYTGGEVIYKKPWYLGIQRRQITVPSGARLRREDQLLLSMMKAGWYFRLSLDEASLIAEPEYKITLVNGEPRQDLRIHYLFQRKN